MYEFRWPRQSCIQLTWSDFLANLATHGRLTAVCDPVPSKLDEFGPSAAKRFVRHTNHFWQPISAVVAALPFGPVARPAHNSTGKSLGPPNSTPNDPGFPKRPFCLNAMSLR